MNWVSHNHKPISFMIQPDRHYSRSYTTSALIGALLPALIENYEGPTNRPTDGQTSHREVNLPMI